MKLKPCAICSVIMTFKNRGDRRESPAEYNRRRYCSNECKNKGSQAKVIDNAPHNAVREDKALIKPYDDHVRATAAPGRKWLWAPAQK